MPRPTQDRRYQMRRERGYSTADEWIFGWTGERMALDYIEAANRKKMAADAMHKLTNQYRTSIVPPNGKVGQSGEKP
jgi:hypothetical protein